MHIADGVLPLSVSLATSALSVAAVAVSLRRLNQDELPKIAVVTASFFVASLIHLPLGTTSVHLLLPGLVGALLGPAAAFVSITIGLVLQSILFQFGGLTALGANGVIMGIPAILCALLFRSLAAAPWCSITLAGAVAGGLGTVLAAVFLAALLATGGEAFWGVARIALIAHLPVILIEALVSGASLGFIARVKPEMLHSAARFGSRHG
ncbi:cobalt transporter CbiM [Desulfogranum mediterraneum]|uniref:cobalt transporter CbiM n=1 Tax=Desulfogranum mediterraneum TaxID=160661 RepID=UPI00040878FD|nr:cobalt transporter CbiM [Desulfogranum mediterraneum]